MKIPCAFSGSSFEGRHFIGTLIKQSTGPFSLPFSLPQKVLLRGWDKRCVKTGDVEALFMCLVSVCVCVSVDHWALEQSSPDGSPFEGVTLVALNHWRGGSPLGAYL